MSGSKIHDLISWKFLFVFVAFSACILKHSVAEPLPEVQPVVYKNENNDFVKNILNGRPVVEPVEVNERINSRDLKPELHVGDNLEKEEERPIGFVHAFIATLSVILVSELGDKTFFIAAIMAMRYSRVTVFAGAMTALALMHIFSALFGTIATLIPRKYTFYISSALFAVFGLRMLREGYRMSPHEGQEEFEETQAELKKYEDEHLTSGGTTIQDPETGIIRTINRRLKLFLCFSPLFIQAATLNFLAEWGDRSQISALVLGARENIYGVILGGLLGHFICTGLAVIGGRVISQRLSVRTVTLIGGVVFLLFAVSAFFMDPNSDVY